MGNEDSNGANAQVPEIVVYFGSQTGKAEALAQDLCDEAEQHSLSIVVTDLEEFSVAAFQRHHVAVLLVANTGEGEPTDNAKLFHRWVTTTSPASVARAGLSFAVFGLGDRTYLHFNRVGRQVDECLAAMGARRLHPLGLGDDSGDLLADFEAWKTSLWPALRAAVGQQEHASVSAAPHLAAEPAKAEPAAVAAAPRLPEPSLRLAPPGEAAAPEPLGRAADAVGRFYFAGTWARVARCSELRQRPRASEGEATAHVEIDVSDAAALQGYAAADTLEVLPQNDEAEVLEVLPLFGLAAEDLSRQVCSRPSPDDASAAKKPFPTPCSLHDALALYCDLRAPPSKHMLVEFRRRVESAEVKERVDRLLDDAGALRLVSDPKAGFRQADFWVALLYGSDVVLDVEWFLVHCPRQRPRPYTIASSPAACPGRIHICSTLLSVATAAEAFAGACAQLLARGIVSPEGCEALTKRPGRCFGLCSWWLWQLKPGDRIFVALRESSFRLARQDAPLIMVGAGAGVAPFRAFWQELASAPRSSPAMLIFGCRRGSEDWIYRDEMLHAAGLHNAASPSEALGDRLVGRVLAAGAGARTALLVRIY